jgi:hypothetical protein
MKTSIWSLEQFFEFLKLSISVILTKNLKSI